MEKIKISKVENVILFRQGKRLEGALHLTAHHLIFRYHSPASSSEESPAKPQKPRELWITYPMIAFCTFKPSPGGVFNPPSIRIRCRDFVFVALHFKNDQEARAVYDSIKNLTCKLGRIEKLYAFNFKPAPQEKDINGWNIYDAKKEYARQGVGPDTGWRITDINADYQYAPTYPSVLVVPSAISDNVLNYAGKYRSRQRIPALTYLHPINNCSITRSSQPLVGVRGNRSVQDERLVAAICNTSKFPPRLLKSAPTTPMAGRSTSDLTEKLDPPPEPDHASIDIESLEEDAAQSGSLGSELSDPTDTPRVYGAQQHNLIIDARPTINAYAMQAVGLGSENMENYRCATKRNLGIDNIHVMRKSLNDVVEAFRETDLTPLGPNRELLQRSGWLKHIAGLVEGGRLIAHTVGIMHSHVLIHCSDGWDRTSQLSALAQLCLDPYFRTLEGFIVLVEKDWLAFGHMFRHRSGFLGSEKWFEVENERLGGDRIPSNGQTFGSAASSGNAFENALTKAKGFFNQRAAEDTDDPSDSELEAQLTESGTLVNRKRASLLGGAKQDDKIITKVKETSPVFHQFLDATWQIQHQFPTRFEFNERFLRRLLYHLYSCQYGTFLYDSEKARVEAKAKERTQSVWQYFLSRREQFTNPNYDPTVDDSVLGKERIIFPSPDKVRWWASLFGREDAEMNSPPPVPTVAPTAPPPATLQSRPAPDLSSSSLPQDFDSVSISSGFEAPTDQTPSRADADKARPQSNGPLSKAAAERLSAGLASLGIGRSQGSPAGTRSRSPRPDKELDNMPSGVEMQ